MNETTVFTYESAIGKLTFAYDSPLWITEIDGVSSVSVDIAQSRSVMQIGSSVSGQNVQSREISIDGAVFEPVRINRERLIRVMAPQVPATLTVVQGGESWYLDVVPGRTPDIAPGNGVQHFQAVLYAAYPYWRTTASYAAQIAGLNAVFRFPFDTGGKWWVSRYSDSFFSTVYNRGNVPVEFQATFTARNALEKPELYQMDTRKKILLRKAMTAGERIIVSTVYGRKGVTCVSASGEMSNGFKYLSIDSDLSMALLPGPNLLRIDAAGNREGLGVRIEAPQGVKSGV